MTSKMSLSAWLHTEEACGPGRRYLLNAVSPQWAWDKCTRPSWMWWLLRASAEPQSKLLTCQHDAGKLLFPYVQDLGLVDAYRRKLEGHEVDIGAYPYGLPVAESSADAYLRFVGRDTLSAGWTTAFGEIARVTNAGTQAVCDIIRQHFPDFPSLPGVDLDGTGR